MAKIDVVVQDIKTLQVLDRVSVEDSKDLKLNEFLLSKGIKNDLYKIKDVTEVIPDTLYSVLVKCNKKSKSYSEVKERISYSLFPYSGLLKLENLIFNIIAKKKKNTHINSIVKQGTQKIAKKFGEEAVELVIEAGKNNDISFKDEAADVLYYYIILLHNRGYSLEDIVKQLKNQKRKN